MARLSIESWILPLVYLGIFDTVVWVRPPWANQIPDGSYNFKVGKRKDVDLINVTCTQVGSLEATKFIKQWNEVPTKPTHLDWENN